MLVKIQEVIEISGRKFSSTFRSKELPQIGNYLGFHKIIDVIAFITCCFGCRCENGHKDKFTVITKTKPTVGEELELIRIKMS